jgi:plastocyanin domain-containing protein
MSKRRTKLKVRRKILVSCLALTPMLCIAVEIKEHLFYPALVIVPANQKVKITFINHDATPEELDSFDLNREKVVFAKSTASIYVGPLKKGEYSFFGEFNPSTATGVVRAIDPKEFKHVD